MNISIRDLLSGVSHDIDANCIDQPVAESSQCLQQIPFSCDSFDAAIAATYLNIRTRWDINQLCHPMHLLSGMLKKLVMPSHFKRTLFCDPTLSSVAPPGFGKQTSPTSLEATGCLVEELPEVEKPVENPVQGDPMEESQCDPHILDNSAKDFNTLADIYWPESLGPLDLDIPSSKYHSEDLILSDSLSGLNRLIASSLDAFQNCSFFGLDKKESASAVEVREATSFPNFKIGSGV